LAKKDTHKLQPVHDVLQSFLQAGLMGVDLLRTYIVRLVQPLRWWEVTMWRYPGHSCHHCSFPIELVNAEVDTRVWRILALKVNWYSGSGPFPLRDGVVIPWVSLLEFISA
jgi:hypothetical protein